MWDYYIPALVLPGVPALEALHLKWQNERLCNGGGAVEGGGW